MALASGVFDTGITWKIKDEFAVLLEWLSGEDLCKEICRIGLVYRIKLTNVRLQLHFLLP